MNVKVAELMSDAVLTAEPHHVVVIHEKKVIGVLSAFDLLKLVEKHRYVAKNPPTKSERKGSNRR